MKKCLYSVNFGNYDVVKEPTIVDGWDYLLFTDRDIKDTAWKVINVRNDEIQWSYMLARYVYINSQKFVADYDYSLMVGGQIKVDGDLNEFAKKYIDFDKDITIMKHPCRTCIYKEAEIVIREGIDIKKNVNPQMEYYKSQGFPVDFGLVACGIIGRRKSKDVARHERLWWNQVKKFSHRDQLSFDFIRWKYDLCSYHYMPYDILFGDYFSVYTRGSNRKIYGV